LHSFIDVGETLWLFTALKAPPRYFLAAKLAVHSKMLNAPGYRCGKYRVWGDLAHSRYFRVCLKGNSSRRKSRRQYFARASSDVAGMNRCHSWGCRSYQCAGGVCRPGESKRGEGIWILGRVLVRGWV
jgi:hypothetical protein